MIKTLGIQLYTIRDQFKNEEEVAVGLKRLKDMGYTDLHTAGFPIPVERFAELVKENGLNVCGTHYDWNKMLNETDAAMEDHKLLGTVNMGIGGMPGPARTSLEELKKFIEDANKVAEKISKYGFKFTYHNHSFEFRKIDGKKRIIDYLVEGLNPETCSFVLDTYWVQHGGGDPIQWIKKLEGRIDILHLKDMQMTKDGQKYTEICEGNMNFDGIMKAAEEIGVQYYVVEQDICPGDPFDSAKLSSDNIHARYMK